MAMTFDDYTHIARVVKNGHEEGIQISAGKTLTIETTPNGVEVLSATCPAGKVWVANIIVELTQTDA